MVYYYYNSTSHNHIHMQQDRTYRIVGFLFKLNFGVIPSLFLFFLREREKIAIVFMSLEDKGILLLYNSILFFTLRHLKFKHP